MTPMSDSIRQIRDLTILLLWGSAVIWLSATGQLANYINRDLKPYSTASGALLLILAAFALRAFLRKKSLHSCCHDHDHHHDEDHGHSHSPVHGCDHDHHEHEENHDQDHHADHGPSHVADGESPTEHHHEVHESEVSHEHHHGDHGNRGVNPSLIFKTILLLLPLYIIVLGHANHYTLSTIQNRGVVQDIKNLPGAKKSAPLVQTPAVNASSSNAENSSETLPVDASGSMPIQVIDLLYAVQMPSYREEFDGKQVELIGQFVPLTTGNPKGDRFQAIRLFITCCAADAKPVGVTVQYDKPLKASEMSWVKITGTPTFPLEGGHRTAILVASKVEQCPAPSEPFVY